MMDRNKKHFIIWKLMILIPIVIGIWFLYLGWSMDSTFGSLVFFTGLIGIITCGVPLFCFRYDEGEDWVSRSVGGKL